MMQFGKAIREGLSRQGVAPATVHPDADLMAAFLEQALPPSERQQVMQHLSLCGDCREVLALALPELDAVALTAPQPENSMWQRWLVVRWAAAAAAVLLVAGTVTVFRSTQSNQTAAIVDGPAYQRQQQAKSSPTEAPTAKADTAPKTTEPSVTAETRRATAPAPLVASAAQPASAAKDLAKEKTAEIKSDELGRTMAQAVRPPLSSSAMETMSQANLKSPVNVATLDRAVEVPGATAAGTGAAGFASGDSGRPLRPSNEPALLTYNQAEGIFTVEPPKEKRGVTLGGRGEAALLAQRKAPFGVGMFSNAMPPPMPNAPSLTHRWAVTADGQLKRSHTNSDDFHAVRVADGVFFKSVAESGNEVWVGGIGGALYHSADDGKSWMKVMPSAGDQPLIADITSIRATQRGAAELSTSSGERWITVDGGQHWSKHQ